jgi:hypothetical protein
VHVAHRVGHVGDAKEERRADVVRKISDETQVAAEGAKVERERVRLVQHEVRRRELLAQARREVTVDLDGRDATGRGDQPLGERAESRADLDDVVAGCCIHRVDDARDVARVGEEVLAEALACLVAVH